MLLPHLAQLRIDRISLKAGRLRIEPSTTSGSSNCPGCGVTSARVHRAAIRRLVDSAIGRREVLVTLRVRRFFCDHPGYQKRTFAKQVAGLTIRPRRHSRRSSRWRWR